MININSIEEGKLYSLEETAEILVVTKRTLYNWMNEGMIPKPKSMGRRRLYPGRVLIDYLKGLENE